MACDLCGDGKRTVFLPVPVGHNAFDEEYTVARTTDAEPDRIEAPICPRCRRVLPRGLALLRRLSEIVDSMEASLEREA